MTATRSAALSADEADDLESKRSWVRGHYAEGSQHKYDTLAGKLALLDAILANGWVAPQETVKLQALGVTFGDALAQQLGLRWVAVEDEYGRDPALVLEGTSLSLFPLTMISKRIESGESVDVHAMFEWACQTVQRVRDEADRA